MNRYWPDIKHPLNGSRFWRHEWEKHGTCAAQLDALDSEKKYFGKSLVLYKQIDLTSVLQKFGIEPSINYYHGEEVQTISQIELCFTKEDFHLRNCTEPGELLSPKQEVWLTKVAATQSMVVCEDGPVFYPPPKKTKY
ncbi:Ribonuclease T2 [Fukomys damarensis]|uniref:Ribonuclease T2 n=1 Tax=Fukomys damarensis TaxID=885580 RepID=A0A091CSE2_FUKDA|nr:Ribonuclease T2 [Fukomys damarensis]